MAHDQTHPVLDQQVSDLIRSKARRLARQMHSPVWNRDDLEQELRRMLLQRMPKFDQAKGPLMSFAATVLCNCAITLLRDLNAQKRAVQPESLQENVQGTEESTELGETISEAVRLAHRQGSPADYQVEAELELDIETLLAELPADLRQLFEKRRNKNVGEIAREQKVSRSTVDLQMRVLRRHLEKAGLKQYLTTASSENKQTE